MGGLAAALRLARQGERVRVLEARPRSGGLAEGQTHGGLHFDAGPYVLLDRPGLEWAFRQLGLQLDALGLRRIEDVYEVQSDGEPTVRFWDSLDQTANALEAQWPGSGARYRRFIMTTAATYRRLQSMQTLSRPGVSDVLRSGGWRDLPFLLRSLGTVLERTRLPLPVQAAAGIWTHVAGQLPTQAPSPLALVPAVIHTFGAWYPQGGIGAIPHALTQAAVDAGVEFRYDTPVKTIRCRAGRATGVETVAGEFLPADAVVANAAGVGTYLQLLDEPARRETLPRRVRRQLENLPLQSPGVCVYLAIRGNPRPPYLRFHLPGGDELCRLLVQPGLLDPNLCRDGWWPARLIAPMRYDDATAGGTAAQNEFLQSILEEPWWREHVGEARVLSSRIPAGWGRDFHLYRESMNPVMTARFMRRGRLAHRCPHVRGLYLAGSATHPGQWVSFCAISGVLAAERVREDFA
jgi:phytoene dehydrogenase-like protein